MPNVSMPEEPPRRPPRRGASILSDTDGDGSDGSDDDDDDRRFAGGGADADSPSVPAPRSSDSDDEDDRDEEALDAQIEALRRQIAAGRLTPSQASETDHVAEDPVDELLGSERWDAGALAAADNDTLDALIDRLAKSRPQTDPMSMLEREEAAARRMKVQTDLMAYLHELRRRAKVDFPPDFAELVEELVANATKRDAQLRAVGLRGKVAASTRSLASSVNTNPFAVTRAIAGVVHPGAGTAFGSLDVDAHGPVDEDARRLAEIERALGEIASGRGTGAKTQPASSSSPASAVSSSPAPSSASALARRLGASSVSAGGGWDDDGEKENDSVRTFRGEFDGENYLEDAREDRELREVDETVDAALRRMKTKGAFPERLTAEEMRRLVDECRSEQGA